MLRFIAWLMQHIVTAVLSHCEMILHITLRRYQQYNNCSHKHEDIIQVHYSLGDSHKASRQSGDNNMAGVIAAM